MSELNAGPLVSVVIPTREAARYLAEALTSVAAQGYEPVEVIVVDAGSRDRSVEIAQQFGARVVQQDGVGLAAAWNQGIEAAEGELIALLDSDDWWERGKLEPQVRLLVENPELDYVIGMVRFFLEPGFDPPPGFRPELLGRAHVAHLPGALLARRSVFERVGLFRTDYEIASDVDWFARLKDAGMKVEVAGEALTHKRVHDSNLSHSSAEILNREMIGALRASIARQRAGS